MGVLFQPFVSGGGVRVDVMVGAVLSSQTITVFDDSTLPATSVAENVRVLIPSALITIAVEAPVTVVDRVACAPLMLYVNCPMPDVLSVAASDTVTSERFHPAALTAGDSVAVVAGATVSM